MDYKDETFRTDTRADEWIFCLLEQWSVCLSNREKHSGAR